MATYTFDILPGLPATGGMPLYFGSGLRSHSEGLVVRVTPREAEPWVGNFALGVGGITRVMEAPEINIICVVAEGNAYFVDVTRPLKYEIGFTMVERAIDISERQLLVLANNTGLVAYGSGGCFWRTPRISWDGIEITNVSPHLITGVAWNAPTQSEVTFSVDVLTGKVLGGADLLM